jgi:hypothetical protein
MGSRGEEKDPVLSMDDQLLKLLLGRFDHLDMTLNEMKDTFKEHTAKDEVYWKRLDAQEAQLGLVKWVGGGIGGSGLVAWLYSLFKH